MTADTPQEATGSQAGRRLSGKDVGRPFLHHLMAIITALPSAAALAA